MVEEGRRGCLSATSPAASGWKFVQICCKGPDRAGAREENRWYSAVLLPADPGPGRLCNRFGQPSAPSRPRSPTRPTAVRPHPHDEQERPVGGAPRCHHAARRGTHPADLRLLHLFPSTALLHPPMYEKKERSGGRGGVAEGKRRSRRLGAHPGGAGGTPRPRVRRASARTTCPELEIGNMRKSAFAAADDNPAHIRNAPLNPQHSNDSTMLTTRFPPTLAPAGEPCLP